MAVAALLAGGAAAQSTVTPAPSAEVPSEPAKGNGGSADQGPRAPIVVPGPAPVRNLERADRPIDVSAYRLGSFLVYPELLLTGLWDNNVFATQIDRKSDQALIVSPSVWVQSDWARHALNFNASGDFTRYDRYSTEDTNDGRVSAEGRYDLSGDANVYGGWRWLRDHEDRESAEGRNGLEPTVYFINRGYAGAFKQVERVSLRLAGSAYRYNYRDVPFLTSSGQILTINNDDRDRNRYTGGLRVGYEVTPRIEAFVQGGLDNRIYDNPVDQIVATDPSFRRDSTGWRGYAGVRGNVPGTLKAEVYGGWMNQNYKAPELVDVSTPGVGANVVWRATPQLNVSVFADRTIEETTVSETNAALMTTFASAYVNSYLSAILDVRLSDRWFLLAHGSWSRNDFEGITRTDDYYGAGGGVVYRVARWMFIDLSYQYRKLNSTVPTENFERDQVFLRLAFPFSP
jgi:hypothetical protein